MNLLRIVLEISVLYHGEFSRCVRNAVPNRGALAAIFLCQDFVLRTCMRLHTCERCIARAVVHIHNLCMWMGRCSSSHYFLDCAPFVIDRNDDGEDRLLHGMENQYYTIQLNSIIC